MMREATVSLVNFPLTRAQSPLQLCTPFPAVLRLRVVKAATSEARFEVFDPVPQARLIHRLLVRLAGLK
jgi:hypothetical protein